MGGGDTGPESVQPTESATFLTTQLANATSKPPGIPRTKATLGAVSVAREAGYDKLLAQAEIELIGCHLQGRNLGKALEMFSPTLTRLLYRPELHDSRSLSQLGRSLPEAVENAVCHPNVPSPLVSHLLVGLEAFQENLNPSPAASDYPRHNMRLALGQAPIERSSLDRAIDRVTPADSRSLQHTIGVTQVEVAAATHPDSVLQVARRMLIHELPGGQKARLLRVMLPALVARRAWQVAWEAHLTSCEYNREVSRLTDLAEYFRFLAISGMRRHLVRVLKHYLVLIRHIHDPWDLCLGLCGAMRSSESLVFNGYGGYQLEVSLAPAVRFRELSTLVRSTVREAHDALGRTLSGLTRRPDDRNDTMEVSVSSGLLGYTPLPDGLVLVGNGGDTRFMACLLRARALLKCDQGFNVLLLLGGLEQTNFPFVVRLTPEIRMLTLLARMQMSHNATGRLENQPAPHESGTENQQRTGSN